MDFALTDDQRMMGESATRFFEERHPPGAARRSADWARPETRALWREVAGMGFLDLLVSEAEGGLGLGMVEAWLVQEAAGRALFSLPLAEAISLWPAVAAASTGEEPLATLAREVKAGDRCATLKILPAAPGRGAVVDHVDGSGDVHVLSLAAKGEGCLCTTWNAVGLESVQAVQPSARLALIAGDPASVTSLEGIDFEDLHARLRLLRASELVGTASKALEMTTDYAKERVQFGKPIGSNQALKHRLANHWMALDNARLAGLYAASSLDAASGDAPFACAAAIACASEAAQAVVTDAIQIHGAIGFSWEHDAHLYFKRVMHLNALQGATEELFEAIWKLHPGRKPN